MKLYFYKGEEPNFGDELNEWLMPRVFGDALDDNESEMLLAIGSILFDHHPSDVRKIVFGSGYGGYTPVPTIDETWDVVCVRGPLTAAAIKVPQSKVSGDTAILLRNYYKPDNTKRVRASFMPHFQSLARGQWQRVCERAGIRFIDPRLPVEDVLRMLCESEVVVAEAMHGAIVSDALRIPWVAIVPFDKSHHMKWEDWAGALGLQVNFRHLAPSTEYEQRFSLGLQPGPNPTVIKRLIRKLIQALRFTRAVISLRRAAAAMPQLSSEEAIARATDHLERAANLINSRNQRSR